MANPVLVVRDNLPAQIAELLDRRAKLVAELHQVNHDIATAQTLQAIVPPLEDPPAPK